MILCSDVGVTTSFWGTVVVSKSFILLNCVDRLRSQVNLTKLNEFGLTDLRFVDRSIENVLRSLVFNTTALRNCCTNDVFTRIFPQRLINVDSNISRFIPFYNHCGNASVVQQQVHPRRNSGKMVQCDRPFIKWNENINMWRVVKYM